MINEYMEKLKKMNRLQLKEECDKYFHGTNRKCEVNDAASCIHRTADKKRCKVLVRETCKGCSFFKRKK